MKMRAFMRFLLLCPCILIVFFSSVQAEMCSPTRPDMLGPFYVPDAPVRSTVGKGYVLHGTVRSSKTCSPVSDALLEFWLTGPDGQYDDSHRATVYADEKGSYHFESNQPKPYYGRPPHIHVRVTARGFTPLVTQHYPEKGKSDAIFDLVLVPSE
jgi:protocatechuate 3,4-dioxygenase beta subunit